jgi:PAS domain S-box-containing protein
MKIKDTRKEHLLKDLAEKKKAEEALRASDEQLRWTTNQIPAILWTTDTEFKFTSSTGAGLDALGLKTDQVVGMTLFEYLQSEDPENLVIKAYRQAIKGNIANYEFEWEGRVFDCHVKSLQNKEGLIIGTIGFALDITERKHAEHKLRIRARELRESNIALKVLLKQRENDKGELEENILSNVKHLIMPYIEKLKKNRSMSDELSYLNILESNIKEIISPFAFKLSSNYLDLTPKELQIAGLIKDGKQDKEISELLNISIDTVQFHRKNIRRKLGIYGKGKNLRAYLLSSIKQ